MPYLTSTGKLIKPSIIESLDRYVNHGIEPGSFLRAVLENDLMEAFGRADIENRATLFEICEYVYNELPFSCHGSPAKVKAWLDRWAEGVA
jgi:hypothetical protein